MCISVAFSPDGATILTGCRDNRRGSGTPTPANTSARPCASFVHSWGGGVQPRWPVPAHEELAVSSRLWTSPAPLPDDLSRLAAWVEAATGLELDERGAVRVLDRDAWQERRLRLKQLGGPPRQTRPPASIPMLYGDEPAARGDALAERGLWDQAEAAYPEAVRARTFDALVAGELGLARPDPLLHRAADPSAPLAELARSFSRWPDELELRLLDCLALVAAGDRLGWERAIAGLLDRFPGPIRGRWTSIPTTNIAFTLPSGPILRPIPKYPPGWPRRRSGTPTRLQMPVPGARHVYRAGRYDEAIRRLEEGSTGAAP